jgi:hypothetical protein
MEPAAEQGEAQRDQTVPGDSGRPADKSRTGPGSAAASRMRWLGLPFLLASWCLTASRAAFSQTEPGVAFLGVPTTTAAEPALG